MRGHRGVTLVELIVVLAILGLTAAVSAVALMSLRPPRAAEHRRALTTARAAAVDSAVEVVVPDSAGRVRFLPDGRAAGPGVDPLTGIPADTAMLEPRGVSAR